MHDKLHTLLLYRPKAVDWKGQPVDWCEEKKDGHRVTILRTPDGIEAFGRKENIDNWDDLKHVKELSDKLSALPVNTMLDGELVATGAPATEVVSRMKRRSTKLEFFPFAAPMIAGNDTRDWAITAARSFIEQHGFTVPQRAAYVPNYVVMAARARDKGIEGYMLKQQHYRGWYKVKPVRSIDAVVQGVKQGKGRYAGMIGSLIVAVRSNAGDWTVVADVGTGLNDQMRSLPAIEYLGKVVEVAYDSVGAGSRLRFPVFMRVREDKGADECFDTQLFC